MKKKAPKKTEAPIESFGPHWIAMKHKEFIIGLDSEGKPIHTTEEKDALKFTSFSDAMLYLSLGYSILRINS